MSKFDLYQEVTDRIIAQIERGIIPWHKPWVGLDAGAVNYVNQKPYSLINQFLLGGSGEWATFKQIQEKGGIVKKGSKSKIVVFWKMMHTELQDENGITVRNSEGMPIEGKPIPILRYYNVFSIENDVEGLEPKRGKPDYKPTEIESSIEADSVIDDYLKRSGVKLKFMIQDGAYYSPANDEVVLPKRNQFENAPEFYSTLFHELTHSTGHKDRMNRFGSNGSMRFGSHDYSKEELVAEIGSAGILYNLGIETEGTFKNSAAYIQGWLRSLRNDKKFIISAASRAEKAIALILNKKESDEIGV